MGSIKALESIASRTQHLYEENGRLVMDESVLSVEPSHCGSSRIRAAVRCMSASTAHISWHGCRQYSAHMGECTMIKLASIVFLVFLFTVPLRADCPSSWPCPYDGEDGLNTGDCKQGAEHRSCKFRHHNYKTDEIHYYWVVCED
jgi:hypothetical protein